MKKIMGLFFIIVVFWGFSISSAAEISSDKMILEWNTNKIWINHGELCVMGEFKNHRNDLTVTKLNSFTARIIFTRDDGSRYEFIGSPVKIPLCKVLSNGTKRMSFNFGSFNGEWKSWVTEQNYNFTYISGSRW